MAAAAQGRRMVTADLLAQIAPPETRSPGELIATARHEAAHCVSLQALSLGTVGSVTIVASGPFAGRTVSKLRDTMTMDVDAVDALVVSTLAGRAADAHWGKVTTGSGGRPGSDLAVATAIVAGKHASVGLGESLAYRGDQSQAVALLQIDPAFRRTVEEDLSRLNDRAAAFVRANEAVIDAVARCLVDRRVLGGDEVRAIIARHARARPGADARTTGGIHA